MPYGLWVIPESSRRPEVGRPKRDRAKVKAGRKAAKRR